MTKELSCDKNIADATLVLHNMTIEPSNLRKKKKEPLYVTKKTVNCDIGTA